MNILILGHNGMLGHMVFKYLKTRYNISVTNFKFPSKEFKNEILNFNGDYIVNCIGSIPQKTNNFTINYELPIWLCNEAKCKIIHPGTDCEMDLDEYGTSKKIASNYIKSLNKNTKIIKSSIIGPELNSKFSLLEWFLNSAEEVYGYNNAKWNGNTTLEWSRQCEKLMLNWNSYKTETIIYSECISKFELLNAIKTIFSKECIIHSVNKGTNKCLKDGDIYTNNIYNQLQELKEYLQHEHSI